MSNPSVIELSRKKTNLGEFVVEDNIGESIHIHLDNFRIDLSVKNLHELASDCRIILNEFINVNGFNCDMLDASFLIDIAEYLPDLEDICLDDIKINSLIIDTEVFGFIPVYKNIKYSRIIKAIDGEDREDNKRIQNNDFGVDNAQRTLDIYKSISENGYDRQAKRIVLFNDELNIRDGQHRAGTLYHIDSNESIPALIMKFKDSKHNVIAHPSIYYLFHWNLDRMKKAAKVIYKKGKQKVYIFIYKIKFKIWMQKHRRKII